MKLEGNIGDFVAIILLLIFCSIITWSLSRRVYLDKEVIGAMVRNTVKIEMVAIYDEKLEGYKKAVEKQYEGQIKELSEWQEIIRTEVNQVAEILGEQVK